GPMRIVHLDPGRVKVIGEGPGWGSITIRHGTQVNQYSVQIVSVPPEQTIRKLKSLLGDMNLTFTAAGSQVVVEGRIDNTDDLERFNRIMAAFPEVINMVTIAAKETLIEIAVTLVEIDATNASSLGLLDLAAPTGSANVTGTIPIIGVTGETPGTEIKVGLAISSQVLEALSAQLKSGRAKIVANPRVVTINRKQATVTAGGEIPYRVVGQTGVQGIEYKPYGITLRATPEERVNDVLLQLHLESSEPVGSVSSNSENPLTARSIDLEVAVEKDKTLAIAGLYNAVNSKDTRGGCFFPLFATSATTRRRELIVLVTPRVAPEGIRSDQLRMTRPDDPEANPTRGQQP
ncbi:MAG: hypothetical protein ABIK62_02870, partial [candidate division WOR-3 bacterium]